MAAKKKSTSTGNGGANIDRRKVTAAPSTPKKSSNKGAGSWITDDVVRGLSKASTPAKIVGYPLVPLVGAADVIANSFTKSPVGRKVVKAVNSTKSTSSKPKSTPKSTKKK